MSVSGADLIGPFDKNTSTDTVDCSQPPSHVLEEVVPYSGRFLLNAIIQSQNEVIMGGFRG